MHLCQLYHNKIEGEKKKELRQLSNLLDLMNEGKRKHLAWFHLIWVNMNSLIMQQLVFCLVFLL